MSCPQYEVLSEYLLGRLDGNESSDVELHLRQCSSCLIVLDSVRQEDDALCQLLRQPSPDRAYSSEPELQSALCLSASDETLSQSGTQPDYGDEQGDELPTVLGDYEVTGTIGAGGMGQVYKAQHTRLGRVVAIKILPSHRLRDEIAVQRFQAEVLASGKMLNHPNVVNIYDARQIHDEKTNKRRDLLIMEYIDGDDLSSLIRRDGRLSVAQAIDFTLQAARGLAYAHDKGIIHRDIKPSNLMVTEEGTIKLLDMGLAQFEGIAEEHCGTAPDSAQVGGLTRTGQLMGSVPFMSPEQAVNPHQVDKRTDIYSLGCTLYYLLAGEAPYAGQTIDDVVTAHRKQAIPSLRSIRPDVPVVVDEIFQAMVAKDPSDRPDSVTEVADHLEAALDQELGGRDLTDFLKGLGTEDLKHRAKSIRKPASAKRLNLTPIWISGVAVGSIILMCYAWLLVNRMFTSVPSVNVPQPRNAIEYVQVGKPISVKAGSPTTFAISNVTPQLASADGPNVRIWDTETWTSQPAFQAHPVSTNITAIEFSPDGALLATAGVDAEVRVWNPETKQRIHALRGRHTQDISALSFSLDGKLIAAAGADGLVTIWNTLTGTVEYELAAHQLPVSAIAFSTTKSDELLTAALDTTIKQWRLGSDDPIQLFRTELPVKSIVYAPDGQSFVTGEGESVHGALKVWNLDAATPTAKSLQPRPKGAVMFVDYSEDGTDVFAGDTSGEIGCWDLKSGSYENVQSCAHPIVKGAIADHSNKIAYLPNSAPIGIAESWNGNRVAQVTTNATRPTTLAISREGRWLSIACTDDTNNCGFIKMFDLATGMEELTFRVHSRNLDLPSTINCMEFTPNGKRLATASDDRWIRLWNPNTGELNSPATSFGEHPSGVTSMAFSADGEFLAAGCRDGSISLWDDEANRRGRPWAAHKKEVSGLAFSPDGTMVASGSRDQTVIVWNAANGELIKQLQYQNPITSICWGSDCIVATSAGGVIQLIDGVTLKKQGSELRHSNMVYAATLLDPDTVATSGDDRLIRLWRLSSQSQIGKIRGNRTNVDALASSPDGNHIATMSRDGVVRIFRRQEQTAD